MAKNPVWIEDGWLIQRVQWHTRRLVLDAVSQIDGSLISRITYDEAFLWIASGDTTLEVGELDDGFAAIENWIDTLPDVTPDWRAAIERGDQVAVYRRA